MTPAGARAVAILAALGIAACGGDAPSGSVDGGVDGGGGDGDGGGTGDGGLHLRFVPNPTLPAAVGGDFDCQLERIDIQLTDLRVVGDAAPSAATHLDQFDLTWPREGDDPLAAFDGAPPGLYSAVLATVDRFEITGTANVGVVRDFKIEDEQAGLTVSINLPDVMLEAGETEDVVLELAFDRVVREIRWDEVPLDDDGELELEDEDDQSDDVRRELRAAFEGGGLGVGDGSIGSDAGVP